MYQGLYKRHGKSVEATKKMLHDRDEAKEPKQAKDEKLEQSIVYLSPSRTIEAIGGYGVYNYEGTHFRVFASTEDAKRFCDGDDNVAVLFDTWSEDELDDWIEKNNKNKKEPIGIEMIEKDPKKLWEYALSGDIGKEMILEALKKDVTKTLCARIFHNYEDPQKQELKKLFDKDIYVALVKAHTFTLRDVPKEQRDQEIIEHAVLRSSGIALLSLDEDEVTRDIATLSVSTGHETLGLLPKHLREDAEIIDLAVRTNGLNLRHVPRELQTTNLIQFAVDRDWSSIEFANKDLVNDSVIEILLKKNPYTISMLAQDMPDKIKEEHIMEAITRDAYSAQYLEPQILTEAMYERIIERQPFAILVYPDVPANMLEKAIEKEPLVGEAIEKQMQKNASVEVASKEISTDLKIDPQAPSPNMSLNDFEALASTIREAGKVVQKVQEEVVGQDVQQEIEEERGMHR